MPATLSQIAEALGGEVRGDPNTTVDGLAPISTAGPTDLTWVSRNSFAAQLTTSKAGAVLVPSDFGPTKIPAILCKDAEMAVANLLDLFAPPLPSPAVGVDSSARISPSARLGKNVAIGEFVVIGDEVEIGDDTIVHAGVHVGVESKIGAGCRLWDNVIVRERCQIGDRVVIHPNSVIGADGFGFYFRNGSHHKVTHGGGVVIGDDVEIGACSTVDRSKVGNTVVGSGTKIDNLVQVAHNVQIGENCLICAQVGVAGSTTLGDFVVLGGQVGIRDNIVLNDGVMVAACSCVAHDIPAGMKLTGIPAIESRKFMRVQSSMKRVPDLLAQLRDLSRRVSELEDAADNQS